VPMLQVFAGYGTFVLLRAMAKLPVPGLETGGIFWFTDLSTRDPMFILPLATSFVLYRLLKKGGETGVQNLTPGVAKALMYFFPLLSFLFTFWLPAAAQLSFFVSGLMSFGQSSLFKMPWFRNYFNMTPLPTPGSPTVPASPSPYKGTLKIAADPVLSQKDLNSRFQAGNKPKSVETAKEEATSPLKKFMPTEFLKGPMESLSEIKERAGKSLNERKAKSDAKELKAYEKKRGEQLKQEKINQEMDRKAERAARKRVNKR